jgi:hypothetical protein
MVPDDHRLPMIADNNRRAMIPNDNRFAMISDDDRRAMIADDHRLAMIPDDDGLPMIAHDRTHPMIADHGSAATIVAVTSGRPSGCSNQGKTGRQCDGNAGYCGNGRLHGGLLFSERGTYTALHASM